MAKDEQQNQYVTFFVAGEEYALGILEVKEIVEFRTLTKMPSTPTAIRGAMNLRGRVVPVLDLALHFGLLETQVTKRSCFIIVEASWAGGSSVIGILADAVSQVMELPEASVQAPPSFGTKAKAELLKGMANVGEKFVLILDLERVLQGLALDSTETADVEEVVAAVATRAPELDQAAATT